MWFWWFILICDCIIPAVMIIAGRMMWKHCPKKINGVVGYRTRMSMINMDTWKFAHEYAGKLWWKAGVGLLGPTLLIHIPFYGASDNTMGILSIIITVIQLLFLIGSILSTEKALKCFWIQQLYYNVGRHILQIPTVVKCAAIDYNFIWVILG